jgi:hypothetical protein
VLVLRTLVLLVSGTALCLLSPVVPHRLRVAPLLCATRLRLQWCSQDPLLGVARSSMSMAVWTLTFSPELP